MVDKKLQGTIYSVSMDSHTGSLSRSHRHRTNHKSPVTTVKYRSFSLLASGPVLLTCTQDGNLCFFRFSDTAFFDFLWMCSPFFLTNDCSCLCWWMQCCTSDKRLPNIALLPQVSPANTQNPSIVLPVIIPRERRIHRFELQSFIYL